MLPQLSLPTLHQVTCEYKKDADGAMLPQRVHTILISTQHAPDVSLEQQKADIMEHVIKPVVPAKYLDENTIYHINPSGRFVIGGPHGDAGLTGRKIIIDTYGGWGAHGGGAFSGIVVGTGKIVQRGPFANDFPRIPKNENFHRHRAP